jgi:hypothetical protein
MSNRRSVRLNNAWQINSSSVHKPASGAENLAASRQPASNGQWKKFGGLMAVVGSAASLSYPPESFPEGKVALGGESVSA